MFGGLVATGAIFSGLQLVSGANSRLDVGCRLNWGGAVSVGDSAAQAAPLHNPCRGSGSRGPNGAGDAEGVEKSETETQTHNCKKRKVRGDRTKNFIIESKL